MSDIPDGALHIVVHTAPAPESDPASVIVRWLEQVDAAALEEAALHDPTRWRGQTTGVAILNELKEWARR